ncbi:HNH endonuclease signature motif containing protein, partial [Geodermatophilus sp. CPCC 205761]|uniref:HNH endonuclease signature motif containing protein n=1 Tax=Geodermatophilus sp. CPCC 205761 TaxID=2936597 RepID=UPI003EE9428F
ASVFPGAAVHAAGLALGHARRLVGTARAADTAEETAWTTGTGGRLTTAPDALTALAAATDAQRDRLADLLAATAGGGLADRPRLALTDALTGALHTLTDLPGLRAAADCGDPGCHRAPQGCRHDLTGRPGLGTPGPTAGYRPGAALDRFLRARDRRCRFPGCRRRVPRAGELDHHRPWPAGPTSAANLAGYCTTDHRGKHQAPGWRHTLTPDGTLTVTTPTGLTATTTPPPY